MTTPVRNNSVFRSFFEKKKLTGPNFIDWYRQLRLLSTEDKKIFLKHPIPEAPVAPPRQQVPPAAAAAHVTWFKGQKEIVREFHACKQEEGQSVSSYGLKMNSYIDNLEHLGQPVSRNLASKMGYAPNNVPFAPKLKTPLPPKKDNPAKDAICHQCGEVGHWTRRYPMYLAELMKKKKLSQGASTSSIFTIELYDFPSKSWIYDTGCGTYIFITTQGQRGSKKLNQVL
nr:hypothetical protein [Tanacetum cinerariifolium]